MAVAHVVEYVYELRVLLAVDLRQLDGDIVYLPQRLAAEEVRRVVVLAQYALLLCRHHWRELLQVADHEQLHASEGLRGVAETAKHGVDGIEEVGAHHAYLVDDKQVERCYDAAFGL